MYCIQFKKKRTTTELVDVFLFVCLFSFLFLSFSLVSVNATPTGPDSVTIQSNETKGAVSAYTLNTSGGYITTFNISATVQNPRWKGFVGHVSGTFTLDDSSGSTIYDWSLTSIAGEVYATNNASTISWSGVACASTANLESENDAISHTSQDDNITRTFNDTTHAEFFVASVNISTNSCPTLNTYIGNTTQDTSFEQVALYESAGGNVIYAMILEEDVVGFDGIAYDFQMIVPENGAPDFTGSTAYYLYVELS